MPKRLQLPAWMRTYADPNYGARGFNEFMEAVQRIYFEKLSDWTPCSMEIAEIFCYCGGVSPAYRTPACDGGDKFACGEPFGVNHDGAKVYYCFRNFMYQIGGRPESRICTIEELSRKD